MHQLLTEGDRHGAYTSPTRQRGGHNSAASDHAWALTRAVAAGAVQAGWSRAAFVQVLLDGPYPAGKPARALQHRRGYDTAVTWLHRAFDGAHHYLQNGRDPLCGRQDFHAALAAYRTRIERTPWPGTAAKTDLRNLLARLDICARSGGWDHTVSERDLAERMGCARTTTHRSNQRLQHARLLRQLDHGSPTQGARWMLLAPTGTGPLNLSHDESTPQRPQAGGAMSGPAMRHTHHPTGEHGHGDSDADLDTHTAARLMPLDAFAHRGLSSSGLAILAALAEHDGQTLAELQGSASISRATAYRQTNTLTHLGLIQREGELLHLTPDALAGTGQRGPYCEQPAADWTDVAKRLGVHGTAHRRRRHHNAERARWHNQQARFTDRARQTTPVPPRKPPGEAIQPHRQGTYKTAGSPTEQPGREGWNTAESTPGYSPASAIPVAPSWQTVPCVPVESGSPRQGPSGHSRVMDGR
ncbi:helix-turn-helix domain-containing protein [Streptomyces sp. TLI_146]|uniref:helix-turn-helix domain-containing protein n=1 Tax=Streptomyces sp. TLI_146 TaxID=1938858 RepID=UPI000C70CEA4|nr:helix-turn-helix domain-containing protein [Streptomyces sp. TLI_146]PKV82720.1 IclR-like helix-turn-helix domain-containing protein [Streptomyces sp. TLI_146]